MEGEKGLCTSECKWYHDGVCQRRQVTVKEDEHCILWKSSDGKKYDEGKTRWDLLPMALIEDCAKVMTFGADKYGDNTWQNVENGENRYYAAAMRHIQAFRKGEVMDQESTLSHLAHAVCNLIFMDYLHDKN